MKEYILDESVWAKIGLIPTKKDLERLQDKNREYNKELFKATKASFDALGFRVNLKEKTAVEVALDNAAIEATAEIAVTENAETPELALVEETAGLIAHLNPKQPLTACPKWVRCFLLFSGFNIHYVGIAPRIAYTTFYFQFLQVL
ncbi:hypothetical protein NXX53_06485 [Bacteroides salyersiae]|nr:hypothetical protein [Bacteroides salyersiae]